MQASLSRPALFPLNLLEARIVFIKIYNRMEIPCKCPGVEYIELSTYVVTGFVVIVSNTKSARTIIPINVLLLKGGGKM